MWDTKYPKYIFQKGNWLRSHNDCFFLELLNSKWFCTTIRFQIREHETAKKGGNEIDKAYKCNDSPDGS